MPANVAANVAASEAAAARHAAECALSMPGYRHEGASVEAMRAYASCVRAVFGSGEPLGPSTLVAIKVLVALALLGAIVGAAKMLRGREGFIDTVMGAAVGALFFPFVAVFLAGLAAGAAFLFS